MHCGGRGAHHPLVLILTSLPLLAPVLTACGSGGGSGSPDITPPSISGIAFNPQALGFGGGQVELVVQVSDDRDLPPRLSVHGEIVRAVDGQSVEGPIALSAVASNIFSGLFTIPPNDSLTGTAEDYFARVAATDSSGNGSTSEGGALTVQAIALPPPPPAP